MVLFDRDGDEVVDRVGERSRAAAHRRRPAQRAGRALRPVRDEHARRDPPGHARLPDRSVRRDRLSTLCPMRIVIVGAGVSGLTCGVVLGEAGHDVTIVAKDLDDTASHAAAAIWYPYHVGGAELEAWAEATRDALVALCDVEDAGVSLIDFHVRGEGILRVPLMDTTRYLPYLRARFRGTIEQREVRTFDELADFDTIINCTGFGARDAVPRRRVDPRLRRRRDRRSPIDRVRGRASRRSADVRHPPHRRLRPRWLRLRHSSGRRRSRSHRGTLSRDGPATQRYRPRRAPRHPSRPRARAPRTRRTRDPQLRPRRRGLHSLLGLCCCRAAARGCRRRENDEGPPAGRCDRRRWLCPCRRANTCFVDRCAFRLGQPAPPVAPARRRPPRRSL